MTDTVPSRVLMLLPDEDAPIVSSDLPPRLAALYYQLKNSGLELVFATRSGGFSAAIGDMRRFAYSPVVAKLMADAFARDELSESIAVDRVYVDDFDAVIIFVEGSELSLPEVAMLISEFQDVGKAVIASEILAPVEDVLSTICATMSRTELKLL